MKMTNEDVSVENGLPETEEKSLKNRASRESPPVKRTTDSNGSPRKKLEFAPTVNVEATPTTPKKNIPKKRATRKSKKQFDKQFNVDNTEPVIGSNNDQKVQKNRNKSLDEYKNWHLTSPSSKTNVNKENQATNSNKAKVFSPNHKLTEYFSDLRVRESLDNEVQDDKDLEKKQCNQEPEKQDNTLNSKQSLTATPSQNAKRRIRQRGARISVESTNHKVTEYFQVRRSERKYKKNILDEKQKDLENKILGEIQEGLEVIEIAEKGRGVITTKDFCRGDFVVEYLGELIDGATAKSRETKYAKNKNIGCYMYYFKFKNTQYCIDATKESGKLGRLINHSRKGNLVSKVIEIDQSPHLVLLAKVDIPAGIELLYDYGDRNKETVKHHPWLNM